MRLAYLLNSYPMTSTTFIRREIAAVEAAGVPVKRFAVRHWGEDLVDPADRAEQAKTEYLLTRNLGMLLVGLLREVLARTSAFARAWSAAMALRRAAGGGFVRPVGYLAQAILLRRRCEALGIDHLHAHFSTNAAAVAMLCRLLGGPRYSFTVHGPDELVAPERNGLALKAAYAARIVAISDYCRETLLAHLPAALGSRIAIVPCGIDLADFADVAPPGGRGLVCVGRLCPQKGQVEIPAAMAKISSIVPDAEVQLIGDGESRRDVEREIDRHGVGENVHLLGWQSNDRVRAAIVEARALLLPSHAEGLPIVIMEAFAAHRPVISTRIAAIPELVDAGCGWLYDAGDAAGLAEALAAALAADGATLAAMGQEGRRRVEQRHDLARIAPKLIALFEEAGEAA